MARRRSSFRRYLIFRKRQCGGSILSVARTQTASMPIRKLLAFWVSRSTTVAKRRRPPCDSGHQLHPQPGPMESPSRALHRSGNLRLQMKRMSDDKQPNERSEADAKLEREIRERRK